MKNIPILYQILFLGAIQDSTAFSAWKWKINECINAIKQHESHAVVENITRHLLEYETCLRKISSHKSVSYINESYVYYLHKADKSFSGLNIYANDKQVNTTEISNSTMNITLPQELLRENEMEPIVFCTIKSSKLFSHWNITGNKIVLLTAGNKSISGLKNTVNISMALANVGDREPSCQYLDFNTSSFKRDGCTTYYRKNESRVVCSCDHLSYFAVLMAPSPNVSEKDREILTYISLVGCSISLVFLVVAVVLYFTKRHAVSDLSQKVHISLALALILLNVQFLPNHLFAESSSYEVCVCIAILLHYSLLATFTWTAIEGFHLYLLLVRVFNIYIKRYLLKLSLVGWGFPAVVVALILSIDQKAYDRVTLNSTEVNAPSSIHMCYVSNELVKIVTTIGFFGMVFLFNITMWLTALRRILSVGSNHQAFAQKHRAKKDICTMLGITCLLGISWGLVFFSFGSVSTAGLYLFCVFNSLHGFFLFLWFCISKCQSKEDTTKTTNSTISTKQTSSK